jgi:hypothetical protein
MLMLTVKVPTLTNTNGASFADDAFSDEIPVDRFVPTNSFSIPPTSCLVESLFSEVQAAYDDRRLFATPEHVEETVFLRFNRSLWDLEFFCHNVYADQHDGPDDDAHGSAQQPGEASRDEEPEHESISD